MKESAILDSLRGIIPEEDFLLGLPLNLDESMQFFDGYLAVTNEKLICYENQGHGYKLTKEIPILQTDRYITQHYVGAGALIHLRDQTQIPLAYFTMEDYPRFKHLEKVLNELAETGNTSIQALEPEPICETCGRRIPEKAGYCPHCVKKTKAFLRIASVAKKQTKLYLIAMLVFIAFTGAKVFPPLVYQRLIDDYIKPRLGNAGDLILLMLLIIGAELFVQIMMVVRRIIMAKAASDLVRDLRDAVYEKLQSFSLTFINKYKTGDLMNRITGDTQTIRDFIQQIGADALNEMLVLVVISIIVFMMNWKLAILIFIPVPLMYFMIEGFRKKIFREYHKQGRQWDKANSILQEMITGIKVIKAFGLEEKSIRQYDQESKGFAKISIANEKKWNTFFPLAYFVLMLGNLLLLYYGGRLILEEQLTLGELIMFSQYANMLYQPLHWLGFFPRMLASTAVALERIFSILTQEPSISDNAIPVHQELKGHIRFDNVTFGYLSHEPVINDMSFEIKQGEMVGLVGHSGSGKSTIINLMMRLYDTDEGNILIDGIPIRDLSLVALHRQIGVVLQETFLFNGSIYDNIRYTKPEASLQEIIRAAKIANIHDFIMGLPDGYDTFVGERGQRLSGGEKQRIAIARAILSDPKILILDEATASLDTHSEQLIHDALEKLIKNRTTIAIAHRLSTLKNADRLLVLKNGQRVEYGTHKELINQKGTYYHLVKAQMTMHRVKGQSAS